MNRSWYKNTWLGKKLGFNINWKKENFVLRDSDGNVREVLHLLDDDIYYIGFTISNGCSLLKDGTYRDYTIKNKVIKVKSEINFKLYKIEYDATKCKIINRICNMLVNNDVYETKKFYLGNSSQYPNYEIPYKFMERTSKFVTSAKVVYDSYNNIHIELTYKSAYRNNVHVFFSEYIRR